MKLDRPPYKNYKPGDFDAPARDGFDVVELKFDGWWGQLLAENGEWKIYSRTGQLKKFGPIEPTLKRTLIHGEFVFGTEWAGEHPDFAGKVASFDAEMVDGIDIRHAEQSGRRAVIAAFLPMLATVGRGVFLVQQAPIAHAKALWEAHEDFEGLVFKNSKSPWGAEFGRMKREVTMDYVCLGFEQSEADRHAGWGVASVLGGLYGPDGKVYEACKVSGLDDEQRRSFFARPNEYVGRVFEATGKKLTKSGALRHPAFTRWRDDKPATECRWPLGGAK